MRLILEVGTFEQICTMMDRIAEGTNTVYSRQESAAYKSNVREVLAVGLSNAISKGKRSKKHGTVIQQLVITELKRLVDRMPKTTCVYLYSTSDNPGMVFTFSSRPVKRAIGSRIDRELRVV